MFYQIFLSPQVKRSAIISNKHGIYGLSHELPNVLRLRILEQILEWIVANTSHILTLASWFIILKLIFFIKSFPLLAILQKAWIPNRNKLLSYKIKTFSTISLISNFSLSKSKMLITSSGCFCSYLLNVKPFSSYFFSQIIALKLHCYLLHNYLNCSSSPCFGS